MSPLSKKAPVVTLDPVATKLATLGLDYPASCLPDLVEQCTREQLSPLSFLELVLTGELERKDERRVTTMLKLSGLPSGKTLEDFDWSFQPRVDRRQIETLATCSYIREKTNVLFLGPPGVGESHLATALGVKAIKNGFSVSHFVLDDLMHVLRADAAVPPARLRAKRYFNSALLIIDEVGFRPLDRSEANLFFRLVSARYERGSIVLTSNKHVRDWPAVFADDEILTTAILDRLLHHVQVLHIDGRSYRLRELGALLGPRPDAPTHPHSNTGGAQPA
ncbi:MAG TPA: IS21-like element helper ATPase IstB [Gemmatimonadaceae bacterium]|nr:IS21-like element helper ATPase IstB [Gemmatimonadaceae bacterium]